MRREKGVKDRLRFRLAQVVSASDLVRGKCEKVRERERENLGERREMRMSE